MHTDFKEYVALCRMKRGQMTNAELARLTNQSPQNLHSKLQGKSIKTSDLERIAEAMGADLQIRFIDRETGEPII